MTETRPCERCKGSGITAQEAFYSEHSGKHYPRVEKPCYVCSGSGALSKPNASAIIAAIKGRKGLRSKRPDDSRAYYVWRMARFHGGADVTMPVCASMGVHYDPWRADLDKLADAVAKRVFGYLGRSDALPRRTALNRPA